MSNRIDQFYASQIVPHSSKAKAYENPVENVHHSYSRLQSILVDMGAVSFRINDLMTASINKHGEQVVDEKFRPVDTMNENLRMNLMAN